MPPACAAVPDIPIVALVVVNWAALVGDRIRTTGGACSFVLGAGASVRRSLALLNVVGAGFIAGADGMAGGGIDTLPRGGAGACVTEADCVSTTDGAGAPIGFCVGIVAPDVEPLGGGLPIGLGLDSLRVTLVVAVAELPAASFTVTVMTLTPTTSGTLGVLQPVVPNATPPPPALFDHATCAMPLSSLAVPPSTTEDAVVEYDGAVVGV